jgi:phosphoribosylaminoimidazolecarboxamide formyltransferase / IMP cyclohydrolase
MQTHVPIQRALISVSNKLGLANFAQGISAAGVKIYSTGGTRQFLEKAGVAVEDVSAYTGFPEMMEGRIKTLHPKIHGGILARHDREDDRRSADEHGIVTFELVVVNLYPFEETVARPEVADAEAIEQIDIGGPSLIRAAAKNHRFVAVATAPEQYAELLEQISATGGTTLPLRRQLATAAFVRTAHYDKAIAEYFLATAAADGDFPPRLQLDLDRKKVLRYGENPHQRGALYSLAGCGDVNLVAAHQLHGKELSYNNLLDLDSALAIVRTMPGAAAVVIKHNNSCGAATAASLAVAMRRALDGDPVSAFGSVIGVNQPLDAATAEVFCEPDRFVEAIVAPSFEPDAVEILTTRPKWKANVRLMEVGPFKAELAAWQYRQIAGGMLAQEPDSADDSESDWKVVTVARPNAAQMADLRLAWLLVRHVKSNAITIVKDEMLIGAGAGQMSRVDSVEIALRKAGPRAVGAALGSDAFFPFADSIPMAAGAGITAIIQPGGSRRDEDVIAACNAHGLAMVFTGRRHFKH